MAERIWVTWAGGVFAFDEHSQRMMESFRRQYVRWEYQCMLAEDEHNTPDMRDESHHAAVLEYGKLRGMYRMMRDVIDGCPIYVDLIRGHWQDEIIA